MSTQVFFCGYLVTRLHCTCQIDLFNWVFFRTFWSFSEIFKISDGLRRIDNISDVIKACDGTYCRSVHIVVGDQMYRPSLHILSSIGTYCRRQKSYTCTYCRRRQYVPNLTAHIVAPQIRIFFIVL